MLNLEEEFFAWKKAQGWTWEKVLVDVRPIVEREGFLPPAGWFQANGKPYLVQAVYNMDKTWEDLRVEFQSFENSSFVQSRNGMRWRSRPEASFSNYLYARGIEHKLGEKYPDSFSEFADQNYGYYDLHFLSKNSKWIDVEIWGEKPNGHGQKHYAHKRSQKEQFNKGRAGFLGVEFRDCYSDEDLGRVLEPFIGVIEPYIFEKKQDKLIHSVHWSNADELIDFCRELASQQKDGKFPTEEWLRKRGKWKDRKGEAYNTASVYIKKMVGRG